MKNKEDLFHLIKSMSKTEKRYFTLDAQKSGRSGSKYLDLFQAINGMDEYDEARLKKRFKRNLPHDKAYLYEAILRSMRDYRSTKSLSARIKERILDARFLYERGLYGQAEERLDEAKELSYALEDQIGILEINKEQRRLVKYTKHKNFEERISGLIKEKESRLASLNEEFRFLDVIDQLLPEVLKHFELKNEKDREELRKRLPPEFFAEKNRPESGRALLRFYHAGALYYQLLGNFDKVFDYNTKVINWWDKHPKYKEEEFYRYVLDISNLLHAYSAKGQYQYFPGLLKKLEEKEKSSLHDQEVVFQKSAIYKLMYAINAGVSENIDELVREIRDGLGRYNIGAGSRNALLINMAILLFINERYEQCVEWTVKIIKGLKTKLRSDIQNAVHLLHLIAVFEIEDVDLWDKTFRATQRHLSRQGHYEKGRFEYQVLDYLKKINQAPLTEGQRIFREFQSYLTEIRKQSARVISLGLDELLLHWVNSKLERRPIIQLIRGAEAAV